MWKRIKLLRFVAFLVLFIFVFQINVPADDVGKAVIGVVAVVVGVVLVATGVGAAIAGAALTTTVITAPVIGSLTLEGTLFWGGVSTVMGGALINPAMFAHGGGGGGDSGSPPSGGEPPPGSAPPPETGVTLSGLRIESAIDSKRDNFAVVSIRLRDTVNGKYISPPSGYSLWASHSRSEVDLVKGNAYSYRALDASDLRGSDYVKFSDLPAIVVSGQPYSINYFLGSQARSVKFEVLNSSGGKVYSITESSPNPAKPVPFIWKGRDMEGNLLPPGTYTTRLMAIKNSNGVDYYSSFETMNIVEAAPVSKALSVDEGVNLDFDSSGVAYVTMINNSAKDVTDVLTVKMKKNSGENITEVSPDMLSISFSPDKSAPVATPGTLNFATTFKANVDGFPVKIEIPSSDDTANTIKLSVGSEGSPDWILYEHNVRDGWMRMSGDFGSRKYTTSNGDVYYAIVNQMYAIASKVFKQVGIEYDIEKGDLIIDKATFLSKSGVGSGYDISVANGEGTVSITVQKGGESITSVYDLNKNMVSIPSGFTWASNCEWDIASGVPVAVARGPAIAGRVSASGVSDTIIDGARKALAPLNVAVSYGITFGKLGVKSPGLIGEVFTNRVKKPMERPAEPDITDIVWVGDKKVRVTGTFGGGVLPHVYVTGSSGSLRDVSGDVANSISSSNGWIIDIELDTGENKINAIVRTPDGREVESGDATVYVGSAGEPSLILVSPRDRQMFEHGSISKDTPQIVDIKAKGYVSSGYSVALDGINIVLNSDGTFGAPINLYLKEGVNVKGIALTGSNSLTLNKTLIGAYNFLNHNKTNGYILRRGDFLFSDKKLDNKFPFDVIPLEPDHVGLYIGNKEAIDPVWPKVRKSVLSSSSYDENLYIKDLYYVTQVPKLVDESIREKVVTDPKMPKAGDDYDFPFAILGSSLVGHYDGPDNNKLYCSEMAYYFWNKYLGAGLGIPLTGVMYPFRNENNPHNSILPAYFCEKTMKVKEVVK